ncbi:MAG: hypothetical protein Q8Q14_03430 [Gemmatimonadales bacterium]|nr:hypothetical protein [Gemmatimonadales bacterium]
MIRGAFRFAFLWPHEPWRARANALARSDKGLIEAATRLAERRIDKASRDRFLAAVTDLVNDQMLPALAADRATTLPEDTTERRILRALVRRDFLYTWLVSPAWRAQLSYQQLLQSRAWVPRIARGADPLAQPFVVDVCRLEVDVKRRALTAITDEFNPALERALARLVDELAVGRFGDSTEDRRAAATAAVIERLRDTILDTAIDAYDALVGRM